VLLYSFFANFLKYGQGILVPPARGFRREIIGIIASSLRSPRLTPSEIPGCASMTQISLLGLIEVLLNRQPRINVYPHYGPPGRRYGFFRVNLSTPTRRCARSMEIVWRPCGDRVEDSGQSKSAIPAARNTSRPRQIEPICAATPFSNDPPMPPRSGGYACGLRRRFDHAP
jgi:hypothetical protein